MGFLGVNEGLRVTNEPRSGQLPWQRKYHIGQRNGVMRICALAVAICKIIKKKFKKNICRTVTGSYENCFVI